METHHSEEIKVALRPRDIHTQRGIAGDGCLQGILVAGKVIIRREDVHRVDADLLGRLLTYSSTSSETDLALMDEEAIALMHDHQLIVSNTSREMISCEQLFSLFSRRNPRFWLNLLVFLFFWRQGWIIKAGSNFGVEFALYRGSPNDFHSEHCVLVVDSEKDKVAWLQLDALTRLMPDFNKMLLLCYVKRKGVALVPDNLGLAELLSGYEVHPIPVHIRRGGMKQQSQDIQSVVEHVKSRALKKRTPSAHLLQVPGVEQQQEQGEDVVQAQEEIIQAWIHESAVEVGEEEYEETKQHESLDHNRETTKRRKLSEMKSPHHQQGDTEY